MVDGCVAQAGVCNVIDVKAHIRDGRQVDALDVVATERSSSFVTVDVLERTQIDALVRLGGERVQLVDVKARIRGGRQVDALDAVVDAIVRLDTAALQLIDVKAHVLGGVA